MPDTGVISMTTPDFRSIPVIPNPAELLQTSEEILRPNIVKGRYTDIEHYLDIQFRLLREDCVRPLREAIASYREGLRANLRLFTNVRIKRMRRDGLYQVTFDPKMRDEIDWEDGRLLKFGSLLCLSRDHFQKTILVGIAAFGCPRRLCRGELLVDFEGDNVTLLDGGDHTYVMLESDAYFEAYRYNLEALQEKNSENFPLREYIVEVKRLVKPPAYLTYGKKYNFDPLIVKQKELAQKHRYVLMGNNENWPKAEDLDMDISQVRALQMALTHDLAIIQGPPGTGKTFVGLSIVKLLLQNNAPRPILIVCYTNHALDQFLEGILSYTKSVVRLGGRCRSSVVRDHVTRCSRTIGNAAVIGMTTTGAAKRRDLLCEIRPKIVLMEEAAEVLEAHTFTALNEHTQHVILIGDHHQLRPRPAVHALDHEFKLGVSLFERLVRNGFPYCTLRVQHRMRPCISRLLVPHIYSVLENHPSVSRYDRVRGMDADMFFVSHEMEETQDETKSRANEHEALFLVGLCRYLRLQGYKSEQVTILATYNAQVQTLEKLQKEDPILEGIRITTVDNYQGEENDIILLSLVRSNSEGSIGFLRTENRVCVALSRARKGFYCIGNFRLLQQHSDLWLKIVGELESQNAIGLTLRLKCEVHGHIVEVASPSDFEALANGGCLQECGSKLSCGHNCQLLCHPYDREHKSKVTKYCVKCAPLRTPQELVLIEALEKLLSTLNIRIM